MTTLEFQIGQKVTYKVCNSTYTGEIVKIIKNDLVVIDCPSGMELFKAGYAVGDQISKDQVIK